MYVGCSVFAGWTVIIKAGFSAELRRTISDFGLRTVGGGQRAAVAWASLDIDQFLNRGRAGELTTQHPEARHVLLTSTQIGTMYNTGIIQSDLDFR